MPFFGQELFYMAEKKGPLTARGLSRWPSPHAARARGGSGSTPS